MRIVRDWNGKADIVSVGKLSRNLPAALVIVGSFSAPLGQWVIFFILARVGGIRDAGGFALLLAVATPLVTGLNWGLRNGYITLHQRLPFADFVVLRIFGVIIASAILVIFGACAKLDSGMVAAVIVMKAADSMNDIWYGRWQHQQRLLPFGGMMIVNGVSTVGCALLFASQGLSSVWIVLGSALGSTAALLGTLVVDLGDIGSWLHRGGYALSGSAGRLRRITVACWQIAAAQVLAVLVVNVPTWAVGLFGTTDDIGRFASAAYMITVGSLLGSSLNSVALGKYHAEMMSGGAESVKRSVRRANRVVTGTGLVAVIIVGLIGGQLFQFIYGTQFAFLPLELILIAFAASLNPGTMLMNAALLALNSYTAQLSIVGIALLGSAVVADIAASCQLSGVLIGAFCALAGSLLKYALSSAQLRRITGWTPSPPRASFQNHGEPRS